MTRSNHHAFGTFDTSAAEQPLVPKASGGRSSGTLAQKYARAHILYHLHDHLCAGVSRHTGSLVYQRLDSHGIISTDGIFAASFYDRHLDMLLACHQPISFCRWCNRGCNSGMEAFSRASHLQAHPLYTLVGCGSA